MTKFIVVTQTVEGYVLGDQPSYFICTNASGSLLVILEFLVGFCSTSLFSRRSLYARPRPERLPNRNLWGSPVWDFLPAGYASHCRIKCQNSEWIIIINYMIIIIMNSLSLRFNNHFPGEPGSAGAYWSKGWWRWWRQLDYWSYKSCKIPAKSSPPPNQHPVFLQARCPSCHPTNSVKAPKGKISYSIDLLTPSSPEGVPILSLTTNSSWLPWGRVAMPLDHPSDASTPLNYNN